MERATFLLEDTNERLGCLVNPDSLIVRRSSGVQSRKSVAGQLTSSSLPDDPLLFTGGGRTELDLDLLFDVNLPGSSVTSRDVRDLTGPLWDLAENRIGQNGRKRLPMVRFVWGKAWNIPGVVTSVAERLEYFTTGGVPQRSWLRMRMLRVVEPNQEASADRFPLQAINVETLTTGTPDIVTEAGIHEVIEGDRLDAIAAQSYGSPAAWRLLAIFNALDDPFRLVPGQLLLIPPLSMLHELN